MISKTFKNAEEDKKQIKLLKSENSKLSQKMQIWYEENKVWKDLTTVKW